MVRDLITKPISPVWHRVAQAVNLVKGLLRRAQVTRATVYGVITLGWRFIAGPVTAILIVSRFTPELQGYHYTFASVLALQIFVELGFSNIVTYFAGHEWAKLAVDPQGRIVGEADALSRLVSLGQAALRWYLMGGVVVAIGLGAAGYVFFSQSPTVGIDWIAPWFSLCILSGLNLTLMPVWSLLEGCNQVSQVYYFRMFSAILGSLAAWTAIYLGAGLWTGSINLAVLVGWSAIFLVWHYRRFFGPFFSRPTGPRVSWWQEIWQVQWRTALSYLSGYFTSQVFTPVLFHYHGPVVAGQFGMTWSLVMTIAGVASMWSSPRGPQFAMMIARKEYKALDHLLYRIMAVVLAVLALGGLAIWSIVYLLNVLNLPFAVRLLPPLPTALLLLGVGVANALSPTGVYLRAHKREPYVAISIVLGVLIGLSSFVLGSQYSVMGVAVAYLGCNLVVSLPWGLVIFYRCRREWHAETAV